MSATAIKFYFDSARQRKHISSMKKLIQKEQSKPIVSEERLRNIYDMIRTWDGEASDLIATYENLSEEEYAYLLKNRDGLSFDTKAILWPDEFMPKLGRYSTLKVRELTDEGYRKLLIGKIRDRQRLIDEKISNTIIPPRPIDYLDEQLSNLTQMLALKQRDFETIKKKLDTGIYMTPSKRDSVLERNPEMINIKKVIQNIKNEIEKIDQRLKTLNDEWERNEKFILRHKIEQDLIMSGL